MSDCGDSFGHTAGNGGGQKRASQTSCPRVDQQHRHNSPDHTNSNYDPHRKIRMIDASASDLRDPIDRTRRLSSGTAAAAAIMAATVEEGKLSDLCAIGGRTSRSSVSSESTIRSGGSPGTKQIETSFCGARPIGSISSFDNGERDSSACAPGMLSGPVEGAAVLIPPGRDAVSVRMLITQHVYRVGRRLLSLLRDARSFSVPGSSGTQASHSATKIWT